jgi:hypothetical protein
VQNDRLLFLTSFLSRQLIAFSKQMGREGFRVAIAAPTGENLQYLPNNQFIRLRRIGGLMFGAKKLKNFNGKIIAFDKRAEQFARRARLNAIIFEDNVGIDLSVWNPKAISGNRQTMILSQYNIAPHQKMLLVIEPTEKDIKSLVLAIQGLERDDYIIALYGKTTRRTARRLSRRIKNIPQIIYLGNEQDLPSLMRSSFAIIFISDRKSFYKLAAIAMGRATAFGGGDIKPNITIKNNLPEVLRKILAMPAAVREKFEGENLRRAENYALEKNVKALKNMIR